MDPFDSASLPDDVNQTQFPKYVYFIFLKYNSKKVKLVKIKLSRYVLSSHREEGEVYLCPNSTPQLEGKR
jgi:hypothetical protein